MKPRLILFFRLLDITDNPRDIADPWYTGNFDVTYEDVKKDVKHYIITL